MTTISLDEIQRDLIGYLHRVQAGETLLIVQADQPIAEIKPASSYPAAKQLRPFGLCAGEFVVPDDFDAPLTDDILDSFEGR
ncbi:MAG TPA: hypothetical protein VGD69_14230 [Herpetosiphonaceae bacterium]